MPSDTASAALRDIAHHIDLAVHFTTGFDYEAFVADPRTVYAVTRCLEIISEASRRLPDDLKARHPSIAWKDMAGAGNGAGSPNSKPSSICPQVIVVPAEAGTQSHRSVARRWVPACAGSDTDNNLILIKSFSVRL